MKILLSFLIIGLLVLAACNSQAATSPTNDESSLTNNENPPAITEPEPEPETQFVELPLSYEVLESHTERDTRLEKHYLFEDSEGDDRHWLEEILYLTVFVTIENTDSVYGTFTVNFSVYSYPIGTPKDAIEFIGQEYSESQTIELQPGESGEVQSSTHRINLEYNSFSWEFEVIPSTKLIEQ